MAGEQRDVLFADLATASERLFLDRGDEDALATQGGVDDGFAASTHFSAHDLAGLVLSCPCAKVYSLISGPRFAGFASVAILLSPVVLLDVGVGEDLVERRQALFDFEQT